MVAKKNELTPAKPPKTMGACADKIYTLRQKISEKTKSLILELEQLELDLKALEEHIINNLPKSEASGVAGKLARVTITKTPVPRVQDWDSFYKHIKKTGEFDLLSRGISREAIRERWEAKKKVPGVGTFDVIKVSVNKL